MNSLLTRQLRKAFGLKSNEQLEQWLSSLDDTQTSEMSQHALQRGLKHLIKRVDDSYQFHERDITLRERSLELSSKELFAANEQIRNELVVQQKVVDTLRSSVNLLLVDQNKPPIKDNLANISTLSEMMLELTNEQKAVERKVQRALDDAESANKAKSEFLATISHEIRTPMNAVIGLTHLALDTEDAEHKQAYIEKVKKNAAYLLDLINNILDLSKVEAGKIDVANDTFSLTDTIEKLAHVFQIKASEKHLQLLFDIRIDPHQPFRGDSEKIYQVLLNLLSNAVKFTSTGTIIMTISARAKDVFFSVADTGMGINENSKAKLFDAFVQADTSISRKFGGTGLGLTICKSLVEHMGGQLDFTSEEGTGSEFYFSLPIIKDTITSSIATDQASIANSSLAPDLASDLASKAYPKKVLCIKSCPTVAQGCEIFKQTLHRLHIDCEIIDSTQDTLPDSADTSVIFLPDGNEAWQRFITQLKMGEFTHLNLCTVISSRAKVNVKNKLKNAHVEDIDVIELPFTDLDLLATFSPSNDHKINLHHDGLETNKWRKRRLTGKHVLIVDDDTISIEISQQILRNMGMKVTSALTGEQALAVCDESDFDAILLDCHLPDIPGQEVANRLSMKDAWSAPIIALSTDESVAAREKAFESGMCQYLVKPAIADFIIHAIDKHIHSGYTDIKAPPADNAFLASLNSFYNAYKHPSIITTLLDIAESSENTIPAGSPLISQILDDTKRIGAFSLHRYLIELLNKHFESQEGIKHAIVTLSQHLDATLRLIVHTLEVEAAVPTVTSSQEAKQPLIESIQELVLLLESFDAQAITQIEDIRREYRDSQYLDYIDNIQQLCSVYDFENALKFSNELLEILNNEK
ncbi:hybrid sensor histidine kinase/response regulator [Alteromonas sp. BMJM2]|uniref:hybrid sensor histidine kinase/response regulator n=1 Tax=Alteromonas sp. BMJM2 TaxID=2954241 RepID=UPI0022B592DD|nr:ATP-binding protein [Alteromonas sp. BMJM2]